MAVEALYIRARGEIFGPFTQPQIHAAIRERRLTPSHEVSLDGAGWFSAGTIWAEIRPDSLPLADKPDHDYDGSRRRRRSSRRRRSESKSEHRSTDAPPPPSDPPTAASSLPPNFPGRSAAPVTPARTPPPLPSERGAAPAGTATGPSPVDPTDRSRTLPAGNERLPGNEPFPGAPMGEPQAPVRAAADFALSITPDPTSATNALPPRQPQPAVTPSVVKTSAVPAPPVKPPAGSATPSPTASAAPPSALRLKPPAPRVTAGLLQTLIAAASIVTVAAMAADFALLERLPASADVSTGPLAATDATWRVVALVQAGIGGAAGVLLLVWMFQINDRLRRHGVGPLRYTPAGSAGWWFVPIANLYKPYGALREMEEACRGSRRRDSGRSPAAAAWWFFLLAATAAHGAALFSALDAGSADQLRAAFAVRLVGQALLLPVTIALYLLVARITRDFRNRYVLPRHSTVETNSGDA